jgi:hypothetical protein
VDHLLVLKNRKAELRKQSLDKSDKEMSEILHGLSPGENMTIQRGLHTSAWLSVLLPSTINRMVHEFPGMRYGLIPLDLLAYCDGCDAPFTLQACSLLQKGLSCDLTHNEIQDHNLIHMAGKAMSLSKIHGKPLIRPGYIAEKDTACPTNGIN